MTASSRQGRSSLADSSETRVYQPGHLRLQAREYDHPDVVALVTALFDDQINRYGFADPIEADPADYRWPTGAFLVGYVAQNAVTCGGYRPCRAGPTPGRSVTAEADHGHGGVVEVKKMYTVPGLRGNGYGRAVLIALESLATKARATAIILETGVRNIAALELYRSAGYQPTESYVVGRDPAINRAFTKTLDPSTWSSGRLSRSICPRRE